MQYPIVADIAQENRLTLIFKAEVRFRDVCEQNARGEFAGLSAR
jgi:hypothetical protein